MAGKLSTVKKQVTPGPSDYKQEKKDYSKKYGIGTESRATFGLNNSNNRSIYVPPINNADTPDPRAYKIEAFTERNQYNKGNSYAFGRQKRELDGLEESKMKNNSASPGPNHYSTVSSSLLGQGKAHRYSMFGRHYDGVKKMGADSPGSAAYFGGKDKVKRSVQSH